MFYTVVFRRSAHVWAVLCLENGLVGQGDTKEEALARLQEAIASFEEARLQDDQIYTAPIAINELHEFLALESTPIHFSSYELLTIYA
jgi:predicted RNase H-like HicB family nuclease